MNDRFFDLPIEKQDIIMNAAMKVFSKYEYRHASTDEIVKCAGISKGLLFHYFESKKGLYSNLYQYAIRYMSDNMSKEVNMEETDFFELLRQSQTAKVNVVKRHPYLFVFIVKAFYETETEIEALIGERSRSVIEKSEAAVLARIDRTPFRAGVDVAHLLKMIVWCSDGLMRERLNGKKADEVDIDLISDEFLKVLDWFRESAYKK